MDEETSLAAEELNLLAKLIGANQTNMKVDSFSVFYKLITIFRSTVPLLHFIIKQALQHP